MEVSKVALGEIKKVSVITTEERKMMATRKVFTKVKNILHYKIFENQRTRG